MSPSPSTSDALHRDDQARTPPDAQNRRHTATGEVAPLIEGPFGDDGVRGIGLSLLARMSVIIVSALFAPGLPLVLL